MPGRRTRIPSRVRQTGLDPLARLQRSDKWYLGGGNRLLWAPAFPQFLNEKGFWDKAQYYNLEIEPLFTWTLLDDSGAEIALEQESREWQPSALTARYATTDSHAPRLLVQEIKFCSTDDLLIATLRFRLGGRTRKRLHLVIWTCQRNRPTTDETWLSDVEYDNGKLHFRKHYEQPARPHFVVECLLGCSEQPESFGITLSEGSSVLPQWDLTPFAETFAEGRLPNAVSITGVTDDGLLFMALHKAMTLDPRSERELSICFTAAPTRVEASSNYYISIKDRHPVAKSRANWDAHFSGVPYFECSNDFLTNYYWYRWYGLRLLTMRGPDTHYRHPVTCEGIGYFRAPISYSAMCHVFETRWMHSAVLAQGIIRTFLDNQRDDGGMRGYIDPDYYRQEMFYHSNWGDALSALHSLHRDRAFLGEVYNGFERYLRYFDRERDVEGSGLYDIANHYETGQEYMRRYTAVSPRADTENWGEVFRLKGVDVTVYIYQLKRAMARIAGELGRPERETKEWERGAELTRLAVLARMWDQHTEMFSDIDPASWKRTLVKAAVCFYPYMTDIVGQSHLGGLKKHLFNPKEFWTPFPVPSTSVDDESFSSVPEWKEKRMNCPWNGRVWPMTNSHMVEALAASAIRYHDIHLRRRTSELLMRFISMMYFRGDVGRPNSFEHYNPMTGHPSTYRGIDDYQHSWVVDLILKYVVGVRPLDRGIIIDPFPFGLRSFLAREIIVNGRAITVAGKLDEFEVTVDGKKIGNSRTGVPLVYRY